MKARPRKPGSVYGRPWPSKTPRRRPRRSTAGERTSTGMPPASWSPSSLAANPPPLPASGTWTAGRCLAPARSALSDLAERGRAEDLDATVLPGRSLHATHVHRPGIDAPAVIARDGLAGVPVERLAAAGCVEAQQPGAAGAGDLEGVRDASRGAGDAASADRVLFSVEVHEDLAVQHDHRLVGVGVQVQRCDLAVVHPVLKEEERAIGVVRRRLPDVQAAAEEPAALALLRCSNQGLAGCARA